jgi:hypothetical protein
MLSEAPQELREKFLAITTALHASEGDDGYYGVAENTAFLLKLQTIDPPSLLIKLRMKKPLSGHSDWAELMSRQYEESLIECEIRDEYVSVSIFLCDSLAVADVIEIFHSCLKRHAKLFPSALNYCYRCSSSSTGSVVQQGADVTFLCAPCQAVPSLKEPEPAIEIHETREVFAFLIPAAMILSASGWACFWLLYHWVFSGHRNTIAFGPAVLLLVVIFFVGYLLGMPVGKLLLRSGYSTYISSYWMPFMITLFTVVLGECLMISWELHQHLGEVSVLLILHNFSVMFFGGNLLYSLYKIAFGIALCTAVHRIATPPGAPSEQR